MKQRSEEWFAARLGKITGTRAVDLMGTTKSRETLMATLLKEVCTADRKIMYPTKDMLRGTELEPEAISYYEIKYDTVVEEVGFVEGDYMCGTSPDGLIGDDGGIEVKCLNEENHIKCILADNIDKKYYWQIMWNMWVTGAGWWDYFGYCPTLPEPLTSYRKRFEIDDEIKTSIAKIVQKFVVDFKAVCDRLELSI